MRKERLMDSKQLSDRLLDFAVAIISITNKLPRTSAGKHIANQLLRSGTSPGANYEEACGAKSRADFIHKMGIVLKELKESRYWLKLTYKSHINASASVKVFISESDELCAIVANSIFTAKDNKKLKMLNLES